ncbi:hypothetical protein COY95_01970, partial [Candidatus Woesearchaeota archaeon CG_4_10_14_0_8_um_filter_47_5]
MERAPDGVYDVVLEISQGDAHSVYELGTVTVDTRAPGLSGDASVNPRVISPFITPGIDDFVSVSLVLDEPVSWEARVRRADDDNPAQEGMLRCSGSSSSISFSTISFKWNGSFFDVPSCEALPEGAPTESTEGTMVFDPCTVHNDSSAPGPEDNTGTGNTVALGDYVMTLSLEDASGNSEKFSYALSITDVIIPNCTKNRDYDGFCDTVDRIIGDASSVSTNIPNLTITVDGSGDLTKRFQGLKTVKFFEHEQLITIMPFDFSLYQLDLFRVMLMRNLINNQSSLVLTGLPYQVNLTKTVYLERLEPAINTVCVKDNEIQSVLEISAGCSEEDEFLVFCDNETYYHKYLCRVIENGTMFEVSGLGHSGVSQQCADGDHDGFGQGCVKGADCDDTRAAIYPGQEEVCDSRDNNCDGVVDEGVCPLPDVGGGGSPGGSGGVSTLSGTSGASQEPCVSVWNCTDWSACTKQGYRERRCTDASSCPDVKSKPSTYRLCTYACESKPVCDPWGACTEDGVQERTC